MTIEHNKSLTRYNSFGFDISAEYFTAVDSVDALDHAIRWSQARELPFLILGGGSNIVFTRDVKGLVIHMSMRGIRTTTQHTGVHVQVAAGEIWHQLVSTTLEQGIFGLENLALIPGCAGAAPIQN
ncbi:MAG: FAD-binding protein, partial [Pseudomonadota bacterium]